MNYSIIRTKKLKSTAAVARSGRHTYREQPTPNADPELTRSNKGTGAKDTQSLLGALQERLPAKVRADAVLCIEYMITASPEAWKRHGGRLDDMGDGYFKDSLEWLRKRHGKENVIATAVHLDETTPHMVAYVVPRTPDGRLSCKDFLGGPAKMRAMQNDFHATCAAPRGLDRGVEGSKAKHQTLKGFYGALAAAGEAPKLQAKDYAAAAMGIKTAAWRKAQAVERANAQAAAVQPRARKAIASRGKALGKKAEQLQERLGTLEHKRLVLKQAEQDLEARTKALAEREKAISAAEHKVFALEGERDALQRRLDDYERPQAAQQKAPKRGRDYDQGQTLG